VTERNADRVKWRIGDATDRRMSSRPCHLISTLYSTHGDSSVGKRPWNRGSFPCGGRDHVQTGLLSSGKAAGAWIWPLASI